MYAAIQHILWIVVSVGVADVVVVSLFELQMNLCSDMSLFNLHDETL